MRTDRGLEMAMRSARAEGRVYIAGFLSRWWGLPSGAGCGSPSVFATGNGWTWWMTGWGRKGERRWVREGSCGCVCGIGNPWTAAGFGSDDHEKERCGVEWPHPSALLLVQEGQTDGRMGAWLTSCARRSNTGGVGGFNKGMYSGSASAVCIRCQLIYFDG